MHELQPEITRKFKKWFEASVKQRLAFCCFTVHSRARCSDCFQCTDKYSRQFYVPFHFLWFLVGKIYDCKKALAVSYGNLVRWFACWKACQIEMHKQLSKSTGHLTFSQTEVKNYFLFQFLISWEHYHVHETNAKYVNFLKLLHFEDFISQTEMWEFYSDTATWKKRNLTWLQDWGE